MNKNLIGISTVNSLIDLQTLAASLAKELLAGDVVLLNGNLGAGKTTFTQFLGKALRVTGNITSPTYTLVGEYPILNNNDITLLIHADLYRMGQSEKKLPLNTEYIQEVIDSATMNKAVIIIEWAEKLGSLSQNRTWNISLEPGDSPESRFVTVSKNF